MVNKDDMSEHDLALRTAQGFAKLLRDIYSEETLLDLAALKLKRMSTPDGETLPGHERARSWFDETMRRGCTDEAPPL
jgi:hypothetical protein